MKKTQEVKELNEKDNIKLFKEAEELNKKLAQARFDASFRKLKNLQSIRQTRKRIARIWTIVNARAFAKLNNDEAAK